MQSDEKIRQLRELATEDPEDALTYFLLGSELLHVGDYAGAAEALERCVQLNPRQTAAFKLLGDARRKAGETAAARVAYERAIAVAQLTGELQVAREAEALLKKLEE